MKFRTKIFKTTLWLLIPFLTVIEGGSLYQRLVTVPKWLADINTMHQFHDAGAYFLHSAPVIFTIWITLVITSLNYKGRGRKLLFLNHFFYLFIVISTALYFLPFLLDHVRENNKIYTQIDKDQLNTWVAFGFFRQTFGFIVIAIYAYLNGVINKELKEKSN